MAASSSNDLILDSAPQLVMDFPSCNKLPSTFQATLAEHQQDNLQSEHGSFLYGLASQHKRYIMLDDTLCGLVQAPSSDQKYVLIAEALHPYLAHKAQAMVRVQNGARSQAFFVADEKTRTHHLNTETVVKRELRALLDNLVPLIEDNFLIEGSVAKTRNALQLKELLKDLDEIPEVKPLMLKLRSLEQALEIHTILRGAAKNAIVKCFMDTCKKRAPVLEDLVWFPCPQGDVNLDTGLTRQRWQFFNVAGMANINYTVPPELAQQPLDQWNNEDLTTYFGFMDDLFAKISGNDGNLHRELLVSLYLQLRGGHDLIVLWLGQETSGKSFLFNLLRKLFSFALAKPTSFLFKIIKNLRNKQKKLNNKNRRMAVSPRRTERLKAKFVAAAVTETGWSQPPPHKEREQPASAAGSSMPPPVEESTDGKKVGTEIGGLWLDCPPGLRHLVVHCKRSKFDVYCGRKNPTMPSVGGEYPFGNPFKMTKEDEREAVVRKYAVWVCSHPKMVERIRKELKGKVLACWCAPKMCHCNIIAQIANQ